MQKLNDIAGQLWPSRFRCVNMQRRLSLGSTSMRCKFATKLLRNQKWQLTLRNCWYAGISSRKHPLIFKAYKAVVLLCLDNGKDKEAAALVEQVRKASPTSPRLITTLVQAMDMLGRGKNVSIEARLNSRSGDSSGL